MEENDVRKLIQKYRDGKCTEEEKAMLETFYLQYEEGGAPELTSAQLRAIERSRPGHPATVNTPVRFRPRLVAIAASILVLLSFFVWWFKLNHQNEDVNKLAANIAPGGNRAVLTLSDGQKIDLDSAGIGTLGRQQGITVAKTEDGLLTYTVTEGKDISEGYNTIETPPGGQYRLNLPDGTKVWLNAASSVHFPVRFSGNSRTVELSGEAYFEVAAVKDRSGKLQPFVVNSGSQELKVLGTHFNINAYNNEPAVTTTLLEGSVSLKRKGAADNRTLSPGQQSRLSSTGWDIQEVDTRYAVAWKNGRIQFSNEDITTIMRMLSRWYNIKVTFDGDITGQRFTASVSRNRSISQILMALEATGHVHFKIEGKEVTVMP
ncbi:MAG: DUF4974 domain-containing protein [Pseudosphingobacterium sp.]|nr:DUF4974 domain-containing protein [Pseudosphingobacterium sp.]